VLDYKFFNNNIHRHINSSTHKLLNLKSPSCLQLAKLEFKNLLIGLWPQILVVAVGVILCGRRRSLLPPGGLRVLEIWLKPLKSCQVRLNLRKLSYFGNFARI